MLADVAKKTQEPRGHAKPRIAPPTPARSDWKAFRDTAAKMGIILMPWQETAARYLTAKGADGRLLFRETAIVVARQNGKTTLMKPHIIRGLRDGKRILHLAQNRELPRYMFGLIADAMSEDEALFPKRRGRTIWPRYGSGQEEISLVNGGWYRIAAAGRGGGRGWSADIVIIDELREADDPEVIGMVEPTLMMSDDPQLIELSNAGHDGSAVLNAVRARAGKDQSLAYLEWSADPARHAGDVAGWAEANPALGHYPSVMRTLEAAYRKHSLGGTLATFETEHLCRWVVTMRERLVDEFAWARCLVDELPMPRRPMMAVSMDPKGERAAAAIAWQQPDDKIAMRLLFDVTGHPIDTAKLGRDMRDQAVRMGVPKVGFDPMSDAELAKFFKKAEPISGQKYSNASALFVTAVRAGRLQVHDAAAVTDDLTWTSRKTGEGTGSYQAVRASDDRPIPAALAAIRAVWLASGPAPTPPRIY